MEEQRCIFEKSRLFSSTSVPLQVQPDVTAAITSLSFPDDMSLLLHQLLLRSSSTSSIMDYPGQQPLFSKVSPSPSIVPIISSNAMVSMANHHPSRPPPPMVNGISAVDSSIVFNSSSSGMAFDNTGACVRPNVASASSTSFGTNDQNENDEYDYESEEGVEALVEEVPSKPVLRSSSKRSRAAEVHNLSEKRRRSRINEKMKALQNLIPNSNKTDKASMLDEAIEYLKQLQLQVQMLTMRNGLSLLPMSFPGASLLPHMTMDFVEGVDRINSEAPLGLAPSTHARPGPFNPYASSKEPADVNHSERTTPLDGSILRQNSIHEVLPSSFNG